MNKDMKKRTRGKRAARSAKYIPDSQIDFSDIPETTDEELKRARRVGRPTSGSTKHLIAIRLDPKLLASLRRMAAKLGKPYQTLIHELLEKATRRAA
jgi:predicted DNA binding CopG/RHH family protein